MRLGFIGAGNMAQAMIGGILAKEIVKKEDIIASAATQNTIDKVAKEFGINEGVSRFNPATPNIS